MEKKSALEALKELARVVVSGIIGFLSTDLIIETIMEVFFHDSLSPAEKMLYTGLIGSLVRSIDRYVHVSTSIDSKGFLPK